MSLEFISTCVPSSEHPLQEVLDAENDLFSPDLPDHLHLGQVRH